MATKETVSVWDLKENREWQTTPDYAYKALIYQPDRYVPIQDQQYMVIDNATGAGQMVAGQHLLPQLGQGKSLINPDDYNIQKMVEGQHSQLGQFGKAALSSATLGLVDTLLGRTAPVNEWDRRIEAEKQKQFGTVRTLGNIAGFIGPVLGGPISAGLKLGAKLGLKATTQAGIKKTSQLIPAKAAFDAAVKVSQKTGEGLAKGVKALGGGKRLQDAGKFAGATLGFAGAEALVFGTSKALTAGRTFTPGERKTFFNMSSAMQEGTESFKEVFTGTAITMGALGAAGFGFKTAGIIPKMLSRDIKKNFFGTKKGRDPIGDLRKGLKLGKDVSDDMVLTKALEKFREVFKDMKKPIPKNKTEIVKVLGEVKEELGRKIGITREGFDTLKQSSHNFSKELLENFIDVLEGLKKSQNKFALRTNLRTFGSTVDKLIDELKKTKSENLTFSTINKIKDILSDKAKFGLKETEVNNVFRKAYSKVTKFENEFFEKHWNRFVQLETLKKNLPDIVKKEMLQLGQVLKNKKNDYAVLNTFIDAFEKKLPTANFSNVLTVKDLLFAGGFFGFGSSFLPGGAITGLGLVGTGYAYTHFSRVGTRVLWASRIIDGTHKLLNSAKNITPGGINRLLTQVVNLPKGAYDFTPQSMGIIMTGKPVKSLEEFDQEYAKLDEIEKVTTGQEDLFALTQEYGGAGFAGPANVAMIEMKKVINSLKPKPYVSPQTGKVYYNPIEKKKYFSLMSDVLSQGGFIKSIAEGRIDKRRYEIFKRLYPEFLTQFNVSLQQGLMNGTIKRTPQIANYLRVKDKDSVLKDLIFKSLDASLMQAEPQPPKRSKRAKLPGAQPSLSELNRSDRAST